MGIYNVNEMSWTSGKDKVIHYALGSKANDMEKIHYDKSDVNVTQNISSNDHRTIDKGMFV